MPRVAPILKIRAALRERATQPQRATPKVVSITDALMLAWAGEEVTARREAGRLLGAVGKELADLKQLAGAIMAGEAEVSPLERLLVFTKLESAAGMVRQAFSVVALCSLALVVWTAGATEVGRDDLARAPRGVRIVKLVRREGFVS